MLHQLIAALLSVLTVWHHHDILRLCVTTSRLSLCIHVDIICNGHASTASYLLRFDYAGGLMTSAAVKRKKKRTHVLHNYLG